MKAVSPAADFRFDFKDMLFSPDTPSLEQRNWGLKRLRGSTTGQQQAGEGLVGVPERQLDRLRVARHGGSNPLRTYRVGRSSS